MAEIEKSKDRLEVLKKIEDYERARNFGEDVENDPPTVELKPEDYPKIRKGIVGNIKRRLAYFGGRKFSKNLIKNNQLIIDDIIGLENWTSIKGGAVVTCNHFSPNDSFIMQKVFDMTKRKRMYKVIREGNYTNPPCFADLFRNCDVLPLSSNMRTMVKFTKACEEVLKNDWDILVYAEGSMWWNYRKPKPLQTGAFTIAVKNNVPVVPIFITMEDSNIIGSDGFPIQRHTVHILPAIYPNESLDKMARKQDLADRNFKAWVDVYENVYNKKLEYLD